MFLGFQHVFTWIQKHPAADIARLAATVSEDGSDIS